MMRSRVKTRKYPSYKVGLLLLLMLAVFWLLIEGMRKSGLPSGLTSLLHSDFENFRSLEQFDSAKSGEVKEMVSGFWMYAIGDPHSSPVAKREYMELAKSGILWMMSVWDINTPAGERHTIMHVTHGYVNPYSKSPDNSSYYCETRIIRQVFAFDGDTCYGASHVDEIWQVGIDEGGVSESVANAVLTVNRRDYKPYTGDIKNFFPDNGDLLDAVDNIKLGHCPAVASLPWISKKMLARSMNAVPFFARAGAVDSLIHTYYKPMVLDELARHYDPRAVPDIMDVKMTVSVEGAVTDFKLRRAKIQNKRFDDLAVVDMKGWLFPAVGDTDDAQVVEVMVRLKP